MTNKRKLELMALEGAEGCFLEIEVLKSGDILVNMRGQTTDKKIYNVNAQIPNPINGYGNFQWCFVDSDSFISYSPNRWNVMLENYLSMFDVDCLIFGIMVSDGVSEY